MSGGRPFSKTNVNGLTPTEDERLAILAEECAEVIQIVAKIQRHGFDSHDPKNPTCPGNRALLEKEIGDVFQATAMMMKARDIRKKSIEERVQKRWKSIRPYLHHQDESLFASEEKK